MKLAIVGSRDFNNKILIFKALDKYFNIEDIELIVSGGCTGPDKIAEEYAEMNNIPIQIFLPNWEKYGKSAGPIRNKLIVENSDFILAFCDQESKGTLSTINIAKKLNKDLKIIKI